MTFACPQANVETLKLLQCDMRGHILACHKKDMPLEIRGGERNAAARGEWASTMAK